MDRIWLGMRIREARMRRGLTPKALASRAGLSHPSVTAYERGASMPSAEALLGLSEALGVSADYLLGRKGARPDQILVSSERALDVHPRAVGVRLRELRQHENLSQDDFARRIGVSRNTLSRWERGECRISGSALRRLCKTTGRGWTYWYGGKDRVEELVQQEPWMESLMAFAKAGIGDGRRISPEHLVVMVVEAARGELVCTSVEEWDLAYSMIWNERGQP